MDFTDLYPTSSPPVFSPGSNFIANAVFSTILIRTAQTLQIVKTFTIPTLSSLTTPPATSSLTRKSQSTRRSIEGAFSPSSVNSPKPRGPPNITHLSFSPFGDKILAFCARPGVAFVFSLEDDGGEEAVLEGGVELLTRVEWVKSGNGNGLLAWSDFGLRLTIWNLDDPENRLYIQNFKPISQGHAWSSDNRLFYLAERHNSKDFVGVYDTLNSWELVNRIPTQTASLQGISVAPRGGYVTVWDHAIQYKIQVFLPPLSTPLQTLPPAPLPAQIENIGFDYQDLWMDSGLGVRCVAWRPGGEWVAVGGWDGRIRILQKSNWGVVWNKAPIRTAQAGSIVWHEPSDWYHQTQGLGIVQYRLSATPATIPFTRPDPKQCPPKMGVVQLEWNQDGSILMSRLENSPDTLTLYPFPTADPDIDPTEPNSQPSLPISVLIQTRPILSAKFHPTNPKKLAFCTGSNGVYMWNGDWVTDEGEGVAECVGIPSAPFSAASLDWAPDGDSLIIMDASARGGDGKFTLVFEVVDEEDGLKSGAPVEMSLIEEEAETVEEISLKLNDLL